MEKKLFYTEHDLDAELWKGIAIGCVGCIVFAAGLVSFLIW